jgi:hypothetical protein
MMGGLGPAAIARMRPADRERLKGLCQALLAIISLGKRLQKMHFPVAGLK